MSNVEHLSVYSIEPLVCNLFHSRNLFGLCVYFDYLLLCQWLLMCGSKYSRTVMIDRPNPLALTLAAFGSAARTNGLIKDRCSSLYKKRQARNKGERGQSEGVQRNARTPRAELTGRNTDRCD